MKTRRTFIAAGASATVLAAVPRIARAQAPARVRRIAWFGVGSADAPSPFLDELRAGLRELGWEEGRNVTLSRYWSTGSSGPRDDATRIAREILAARPELIIAQGRNSNVMRSLETDVPVVFATSGDPVDSGTVQSLARPGGNLTGITLLAYELVGKRIELLKEAVPQVRRIAVLARPEHSGEPRERRVSEEAARKMGITSAYFPMSDVVGPEAVFPAIAKERCDAIVVFPDGVMVNQGERIARFAAGLRMPAISGWASFAENGFLLTYGPNLRDTYRSLGRFVDRILRGTRPSDLPVELPRHIELVVNLKTAKALGITIPQSILVRADRVIE